MYCVATTAGSITAGKRPLDGDARLISAIIPISDRVSAFDRPTGAGQSSTIISSCSAGISAFSFAEIGGGLRQDLVEN